MVSMGLETKFKLEDILTEKQVYHIVKKYLGDVQWKLIGFKMRSAAEGLAGFLGDHFRVAILVKVGDEMKKLQLFIKTLPLDNNPKAKFIDDFNYFRREMVVFKLFEELGGADGPTPWRTKAFIYTDSLLVMPDVSFEGYTSRPYCDVLDLKHALLTIASMARFHAAFANYETKRNSDATATCKFVQEYEEVLKEPTFADTPWLAAAAKLTNDILNEFSTKFNVSDLRAKLHKTYIETCDSLRTYEDTLNVVIHKDLWISNIMFKYEEGEPKNSILIDFQCIRYAPPAFDVMIFLYLNTTRSFREQNENTLLREYFKVFSNDLRECTRRRLLDLNYDYEEFHKWCERARMFGALEAIAIFPYVTMEPEAAQKNFDDPDTYMEYMNDRSAPVLEHARKCATYKDRQLEVSEEFVERYILNRQSV